MCQAGSWPAAAGLESPTFDPLAGADGGWLEAFVGLSKESWISGGASPPAWSLYMSLFARELVLLLLLGAGEEGAVQKIARALEQAFHIVHHQVAILLPLLRTDGRAQASEPGAVVAHASELPGICSLICTKTNPVLA
ncbi:hypothetical protein PR202_gb17914 [Eleusine coracana subsp. coracana]|uniref:Uncharacterized protein n=1 Tax=Eleusine coracana subsp. coracana TaxID=191504 RepID=A0AAV5F5L7_ELECO|nr:hypothetical protein PR202_gb17914 [Eleusine coracana subsp. coracana]